VSELEEYLCELFLSKIEAALADNEIEFTPDEISQVVSLSIQNALESHTYIKLHGR
jgi:hypothetical protein